MSSEVKVTPESLPEKPVGWTKRMTTHLNFGGDGGCGMYTVHDPDGNLTPIGYQYDTRKGGLTGFVHANDESVMSWSELRAKWPELCKAATSAA
jgi:hypothetical protein